jgi:hypothetical protein
MARELKIFITAIPRPPSLRRIRPDQAIDQTERKFRLVGQASEANQSKTDAFFAKYGIGATNAGAATDKMAASTEGMTTKSVALGSALGSFVGGIGVQAVMRLGSEIAEMVARRRQVDDRERIIQSAHGQASTRPARCSGNMRGGTQGLVQDMELMQAANKAVMLGLPVNV